MCPDEMPCTSIKLSDINLKSGGGKVNPMQCENAFGTSGSSVSPKSCLSDGPPPPPAPPVPGCNVTLCFRRCVVKYGGTIAAGESYNCAKGCASMKDGAVSDRDKYCRISPDKRYAICEKDCSGASSDPSAVAECRYGCGYWS